MPVSCNTAQYDKPQQHHQCFRRNSVETQQHLSRKLLHCDCHGSFGIFPKQFEKDKSAAENGIICNCVSFYLPCISLYCPFLSISHRLIG